MGLRVAWKNAQTSGESTASSILRSFGIESATINGMVE